METNLIDESNAQRLTGLNFNHQTIRADNKEDFQENSKESSNQSTMYDSEECIMEINEERKRRRGIAHITDLQNNMEMGIDVQRSEAQQSMETDASNPKNFLLAGSGSQACQNP